VKFSNFLGLCKPTAPNHPLFPWSLIVINIPNDQEYKIIFSIPRFSKIYPNWDFWYEKKPSGNPGCF
jgi:hypothetical protein